MKLHPQFFDYVRSINPSVDFHQDVIVSIDSDGNATIVWNLPGKPPSDADIDVANPPAFVEPPSIDKRLADLEIKTFGQARATK